MDEQKCGYLQTKPAGKNLASLKSFRDANCSINDFDVQTTTLDRFLPTFRSFKFAQAIVRMDLEDFEPLAIVGGQRFLEEVDIPFIVMEFGSKVKTLRLRKPKASDKKKQNFIKIMITFLKRQFVPTAVEGFDLDISRPKNWPPIVVWRKK